MICETLGLDSLRIQETLEMDSWRMVASVVYHIVLAQYSELAGEAYKAL